MRNSTTTRHDIMHVVAEYLTLWGRLNRWVSEWAKRDRARAAARRGRCGACGGHGTVVGAGKGFETCRSCGGNGRLR